MTGSVETASVTRAVLSWLRPVSADDVKVGLAVALLLTLPTLFEEFLTRVALYILIRNLHHAFHCTRKPRTTPESQYC